MQISDQLIEHLMIAARGIAWDKGVTVSEAEIARQHTRQVLDAALSAAEPQPAPSVAVKALQMADETFRDLGWHDKYEATTAALAVLSAQVQDVAGWQDEEKLTPKQAWTILCETPDITSPEEYPDHALITFEQLQSYMERAHNPVAWQDISTAPRDGTKILMRGGAYHGVPFPGYWNPSSFAPDRPWVSVVNDSRLYEHVPTHWMPLPEAPK